MATTDSNIRRELPVLKRRLSWFDATAVVIGSMIGSGVFVAPAIMAGWVQSPGVLIGVWVFGGLFTILGALAYAELAAMAPMAGGQYVFLKEAFGPFVGFLYGWTLFTVIQTGFIAAVAIAFAKYLGVFAPALGEANVLATIPLGEWLPERFAGSDGPLEIKLSSAQLVACGLIIFLTAINLLGLRMGALVQNLFTIAKLAGLAVIIVFGLTRLGDNLDHFQPLFTTNVGAEGLKVGFAAALAVALSKALFAYDAWNTVTFVAEEVRQPERNLPRALFAGCLTVTAVYVLANVAYLAVVPAEEMASVKEQRIAERVAANLFGKAGVDFVVLAILISTIGCVNGLVLSGARVLYAMARENLFFRSCGRLHPATGVPAGALLVQCGWACLLAVSGSYDMLLTYTSSAAVLFGGLTVAALFRLRSTQPDRPRPYRCWGYPFTPALYLVCAVGFLAYVVQGDPVSALIGVALVASGAPYYLFRRRR